MCQVFQDKNHLDVLMQSLITEMLFIAFSSLASLADLHLDRNSGFWKLELRQDTFREAGVSASS